MADERSHYEPLRQALEIHILSKLRPQYHDPKRQAIARSKPPAETIYLEITADKGLSNQLKAKIGSGRELIYLFLKKDARPDLTGFIEIPPLVHFIAVEFKDETLTLDDIYQLKKYADLLDAKYSLLISTREIPEEIKRLRNAIPDLLSRSTGYNALTLVHYDSTNKSLLDWFPKDPFQSDIQPDSEFDPGLDVKFGEQTLIKDDWEVPLILENKNEFKIRIYKILVNGVPLDSEDIRLDVRDRFAKFLSEEYLPDGEEEEETYVFDLLPHSVRQTKLLISKRSTKAGNEFQVNLVLKDSVLKDEMRYSVGSFKLN